MSYYQSKGTDQQQFLLTQKFTPGYQNKLQQDEVPSGSLVSGSQNVIIDDDGKPRSRFGSRYLGTKADSSVPDFGIGSVSCGRLRRRDGEEIPIVTWSTYTKYLHPLQNQTVPGTGGTPDWVMFETGFVSNLQFGFAANDLNSDNFNKICFCNGDDTYRIWNGALDLVSQWSATTITTQSSFGLAAALFPASGTIIISTKGKQKEFAYTGVSSGTFTGVTPDPNLGLDGSTPLLSGMAITLKPTPYASAPKGNVLLASDNARVLVGNVKNSSGFKGGGAIYGSKTDDPTDFTFSAPRLPTDGFILNIAEGGGNITGGVQFEHNHYFFKPATIKDLTFSQDGNDIVQIQSQNSYDETSTGDDGSVSAMGVCRADNAIVYVTPTRLVKSIGRIMSFDFPQGVPLSDPIKKLTDSIPFDTQTASISWRGRLFITCKQATTSSTNDQILVLNQRYQCWEPPMIGINAAGFFTYQGNLYAILATTPNVVKLWDASQDFLDDLNSTTQSAGVPINSVFVFPDDNYGERSKRKEFDQFWIEGEMDQAGSATFSGIYDEGAETRSGTLSGTENGFFYQPASQGPFGDQEFGVMPFGADPDAPSGARRFRMVLTTTRRPFYTFQFKVESSSYIKILAFGPNVVLSTLVKPTNSFKAMG